MRRLAIVMAAALAATAAAAVGGTADAQAPAAIVVTPAATDPGATVTVSNDPAAPCAPPRGTANPSASVDLYATGSATPVNRAPYQGAVSPAGAWSVEVRLEPDLPPGTYRVEAGCYTDSGLNSGFGPGYSPASLELRLQEPGQPASPRRGRPGDSIQVGAGEARCAPPARSPSPRVRVSLLDANKATRAEAEGPVDPATGGWTVGLRVPDLPPQSGEISAACLARVGAPSPYARYRAAPFTIDAAAATPTTASPATTAPAATAPPGASTTAVPATAAPPAPTSTLPPTPVAAAVVAEPTYTG